MECLEWVGWLAGRVSRHLPSIAAGRLLIYSYRWLWSATHMRSTRATLGRAFYVPSHDYLTSVLSSMLSDSYLFH